jgi:hypothetical protein
LSPSAGWLVIQSCALPRDTRDTHTRADHTHTRHLLAVVTPAVVTLCRHDGLDSVEDVLGADKAQRVGEAREGVLIPRWVWLRRRWWWWWLGVLCWLSNNVVPCPTHTGDTATR